MEILYIWLFNMSSRLHCQLSDALSNVYISVIFFYLKIVVIFKHSEENKSIRERKVISNLNIYVQFSHSVVSDSLWPHVSHHTRPPCLSPAPGVHSNSRPSSWWCHTAISSSVVPFSSCPQSLPASESFPMSQLFTWGCQSTGVSALASFLPKNTQDWSLLE